MARNVELLERVMQHITDHPEQHDQVAWLNECGTAACFAGWACLLSGWQPVVTYNPDDTRVMSPDTLTEDFVSDRAGKLLGLTHREMNYLFHGANTRDVLQRMVKDLVNGDKLRAISQYLEEA